MITKEALIAEIEHIPPKDMETVYKLIQVFTLSTQDISSNAERQWTQPDDAHHATTRQLGSLRGSITILGDIIAPALDEKEWEVLA